MYHIAIVTEVDPTTCTARVRIPERDNVQTSPFRILVPTTKDAQRFHLPSVDEQVIVLIKDNGTEGVIMGSVYTARNPTSADLQADGLSGVVYPDGSKVIFDEGASMLTVDSRSDVVVTADQDCTITATRNALIDGGGEASISSSTTTVKVSPAGVTIAKGGSSLKTELVNLLNGLQAETHLTAMGPTGPPVNLATYAAVLAVVNLMFEA